MLPTSIATEQTGVQWLRAQFDEEDRIARATDDTLLGQRRLNWSVQPVDDAFSKVLAGGHEVVGTGEFTPEDAARIARHDPARALCEVESKRRIVDMYATALDDRLAVRARMRTVMHSDPAEFSRLHLRENRLIEEAVSLRRVVLLLALPYVDQCGYPDAWRSDQR